MEHRKSIREILAELKLFLASTASPLDIQLRFGASFRDIRGVEALLDVEFPLELTDLLLVANGQHRHKPDGSEADLFFPEFALGSPPIRHFSGYGYFCGVEEILLETLALREEYQRILDNGEELRLDETIGPVRLHQSLLVLSSSWDPTMICMDLAPPAGGEVGQIVAINEQPWVAAVLAPSLTDFFELILTGYESSRFRCIEVDGMRYCTEQRLSEAN